MDQHDGATASKTEFAALAGVSGGRVSQWIKRGKIGGEALVGSGRHQRVAVSIALHQLKRRLDPGQRAINGSATKLTFEAESPSIRATSEFDDRLQQAILKEREARAESAQMLAAQQAGQLYEKNDVERAVGKCASIISGSLLISRANYAEKLFTAATAKNGMKEVLIVLKKIEREFRGDIHKAILACLADIANKPAPADSIEREVVNDEDNVDA